MESGGKEKDEVTEKESKRGRKRKREEKASRHRRELRQSIRLPGPKELEPGFAE